MIFRDCPNHRETEMRRPCGSSGCWDVYYNGVDRSITPGTAYEITFDNSGNGFITVPSTLGGAWNQSGSPSCPIFTPNGSNTLLLPASFLDYYNLYSGFS